MRLWLARMGALLSQLICSRKWSVKSFLALSLSLVLGGWSPAAEVEKYRGALEDWYLEGVASVTITTTAQGVTAAVSIQQNDGTKATNYAILQGGHFLSPYGDTLDLGTNMRLETDGDGSRWVRGSMSVRNSDDKNSDYNVELARAVPPADIAATAGTYSVVLAGADPTVSLTDGIVATGHMTITRAGTALLSLSVLGIPVTGRAPVDADDHAVFLLRLSNGAYLSLEWDFGFGRSAYGEGRLTAPAAATFGRSIQLPGPVNFTATASRVPGGTGFGTEAKYHLSTTIPGDGADAVTMPKLSAPPATAVLRRPTGRVLFSLNASTGQLVGLVPSMDPKTPASVLRGEFLPSLGNGFGHGFVYRAGKLVGSFDLLPGWVQP